MTTATRERVRPAAPAPDSGRIRGLDGVRALAILAVLAFHVSPVLLPGGYLGVDVFFVISGFLITTLLARELTAHGRIDLRRFWVRRARRLLPALGAVVLIATLLALVAGNDLRVGIGRQILGALTFSSNWLEIAAGSSYFATTSPQLFVNFWSLAVEEQFYLVWPVAFAVLMAAVPRARARVWTLLGLAAASALAMAVLVDPSAATRVYYGTDTHAFGLLLGAALALALRPGVLPAGAAAAWERLRVPVALAGFGVLVVLAFVLDPTTALPYRGGLLLAALATAAVLGGLPGTVTPVTRALELRPLAWVGERSYGIYLWHWPALLLVDAFGPALALGSAGWWVSRGVAVLLTLAIAAVSYRFLEAPVRELGFRGALRAVGDGLLRRGARERRIIALVGLAVVVTFALAVWRAPQLSQVEQSLQAGAPAAPAPAPSAPASEGTQPPSAEASPPAAEGAPSGAAEGAPSAEPSGHDDAGSEAAFTGADVSGFGDSMMSVAAPGLTDRLPGIDLDAKPNRQWPAIAEEVEAALAAGSVREYVVIAAGTNAGSRDKALIDGILDRLGPDRKVVLVNLYGASTFVPASNAVLAEIDAARPNVVVADWAAAVAANPGILQPDGVHPDMDGMYVFADTVLAAVVSLVTA